MVKEFLSQKGVSFKEKDVSFDRLAGQELMDKTGQMSVPVTVIGSETIVGFNRARLEEALVHQKQAQHLSFGAAVADASKITAQQGLVPIFGAYVGKVKPGSAAEKLGVDKGDIIIEVNMQSTSNASDLERAFSQLRSGSRLSIVFLRGSKKLTADGFY
jgi:S1-C subfamily serine protease